MGRSSCATLDALIAEATVDCYNDSDCVTGFYTMLDDNLAVPFQTVVLGVDVTVAGIDLTEDEQIMAVCTRGRSTQLGGRSAVGAINCDWLTSSASVDTPVSSRAGQERLLAPN